MIDNYFNHDKDNIYCYPNSFVLKNKLDITDPIELQEIEQSITAIRLAELEEKPVKGNFDLKHLQDIHKFIFKDIYPWAGELRKVRLSKGETVFCYPENIISYAGTIFSELKKENYLVELEFDQLCERLAYYFCEINMLHPFREGNGRTLRVWIANLATLSGYEVDFTDVSKDEMIEACIRGYMGDNRLLKEMFIRITSPLEPEISDNIQEEELEV